MTAAALARLDTVSAGASLQRMEFDWRNPWHVMRWQRVWPVMCNLQLVLLLFVTSAIFWPVLLTWLVGLLVLLGRALWHPNCERLVRRDIAALQRAWPWFGGHPLTCAAIPEPDEVRRVACARGFRHVEIDGSGIRSLPELAMALQAHTRSMRWPEEPRARVLALLRQIACDEPRRTVLVWRGAKMAVQHDPAFLANVVADHTAQSLLLPSGLLLLVDLPPSAAPASARRDAQTELEQPLQHVLQHAPAGAWWKPAAGARSGIRTRLRSYRSRSRSRPRRCGSTAGSWGRRGGCR